MIEGGDEDGRGSRRRGRDGRDGMNGAWEDGGDTVTSDARGNDGHPGRGESGYHY